MGITVLEEDTIVCEPSKAQVRAYAEFLGVDLEKEPHLDWIVLEGLVAPVPHPWKACTENGEEVFYYNFKTGESVWDHPSDAKYHCMVEEHRQKYKATETVTRCFLPSQAMKTVLDDMWCCGFGSDQNDFEEIKSQVEAKYNTRLRLALFPAIFPSFADALLPYLDVTQKDIDDAWLEAALDVRGRPAMRQTSSTDYDGYCPRGVARDWFQFDAQDVWELNRRAGQPFANMVFDDDVRGRPTMQLTPSTDFFGYP